MHNYSESSLVEAPTIALFAQLGYETVHAFSETFGKNGALGRETSGDVVLVGRLRTALQRLNPGVGYEAIEGAIEELTRDRSTLSMANANREVYRLLKDGVRVSFRGEDDEEAVETVRVIDWNVPASNDFLLASQFKVSGDMYNRRPDLVGFVNGLPLILIELKATHQQLKHAFDDNLRDYKDTIPQLFWYNALIILSNGHESKVGSITAGWEHFFEWKKISDEHEQGVVSLETMVRGTCEQERLLDIVESFTLFSDAGGALVKLIAKNHQFLGVNNALDAVRSLRENAGRLGVFWHTQGSGKSYSMVFFSQKVLRKIRGNWTFLIITDRQELDDQIYKTFQNVGAVTEHQVQATSGAHLQQLLREDHRNIFTLIQKFHVERGSTYPQLSDRSDIIVMTDEAHRTQYDMLALNMRNALPHAAFIGFTGTPLMAGEEKTRQVFGDYVSVYNFGQSEQDGTTVPLYYENRIPELQLTNENLNEAMEHIIEEAALDDTQERRLEREFAREYHLITHDGRLETIAADIVSHFMERGFRGKAMVVSIDKATAVRMYDKVQKHWKLYLDNLKTQVHFNPALQGTIAYMEQTDMAVVVSQSQNEVDDFRQKGLDITPHRRRMLKDDLETKFKDEDDALRIVFVCAMWMTGFDVPSLSTLYLDKPMRNHTLMQTIARANRVYPHKVNGLIVDYLGVFRDLQKALAIYGTASSGGTKEGEIPVKDKAELVAQLEAALADATAYCREQGIDTIAILAASPQDFKRMSLMEDAIDTLVSYDNIKKRYLSLAGTIAQLFKAILPDAAANVFVARVALFVALARDIRQLTAAPDISGILDDIEQLIASSVSTRRYVIRESNEPYNANNTARIDLSTIDFDALRTHFEHARQHIEAEKLRGAIQSKLKRMVQLNRSRANYQEKFQRLIDDYNSGSANIQLFFDNLIAMAQELNIEEQRHIAEQLSEEELTVFDLLTQPAIELTEKEQDEVKKVARELLATLKHEKLVLDWRKKQQARARVEKTVEEILDKLPRAYNKTLYDQKCSEVFQHIYDSYYGLGKSVYEAAG
ncbi:MAG TPA: type I restriction endonuclease subunit R [Ktedonobacteraceae bacterium]|nr:type I restriction endonuclease subunit R [Ktedonobacteraceae bacterium]